MALLDDVKLYCRTDEDLTALVDAAKLYLTNAGITATESNALYCLAIKMLVVHWHNNREVVGSADKLALGIDCIISQLKFTPTVVV